MCDCGALDSETDEREIAWTEVLEELYPFGWRYGTPRPKKLPTSREIRSVC